MPLVPLLFLNSITLIKAGCDMKQTNISHPTDESHTTHRTQSTIIFPLSPSMAQ